MSIVRLSESILVKMYIIDFLRFCDAMVLLCADQEIQGIVVISLDCSHRQPPKLTVQFELL